MVLFGLDCCCICFVTCFVNIMDEVGWCLYKVYDATVPGMDVGLLLLLLFIRHLITKSWLISTPSHRPKPFQPSEQKWWGTWGTHKQLSCLVPNLPCSMGKGIEIALGGARIMQNAKMSTRSDTLAMMLYENFRKINQIWHHQDHPKANQPLFSSSFSTSVPGPKQVGLEPPLQVVGLPWPASWELSKV